MDYIMLFVSDDKNPPQLQHGKWDRIIYIYLYMYLPKYTSVAKREHGVCVCVCVCIHGAESFIYVPPFYY